MHVKAAFRIDGSTTRHMRNVKVMASVRASVEKMSVSGLGHPTRSREMAIVDDAVVGDAGELEAEFLWLECR